MKIDVLGVKIDALTKSEVIDAIKDRLRSVPIHRPLFIVTPYSESLVAAQRDEEFRRVLNSADIALPDGIGILWAAHFLRPPSPGEGRSWRRGRVVWKLITSLLAIIFHPQSIHDPIPEKISGREFVWDLAELAADNGYSIFLLGGFGDTPARAAATLKERFPNLKIAGTYSNLSFPRRRESSHIDSGSEAGTTERALSAIGQAKPDFLFVALGPIRQEKWLSRHLPNLPVRLAIGLGGTFDYLAQKRPLVPQFWAQRGLEWLWRLLTQPRRLVRISRGIFGLIYYCVKQRSVLD